MKNIFRYDLIEFGNTTGVIALGMDYHTRRKSLSFFPNIRKTSNHMKLGSAVEDLYLFENRYLYVIRESTITNEEGIIRYDLKKE